MTAHPPSLPLTVGICTRGRRASLLRCLRSLRHARAVTDRVVVVDDASDPPVAAGLREELGDDAPPGLVLVRFDQPANLCAGRNRVADEARTPFILYLDDDAALLAVDSVGRALRVMEADPSVAGIAFPQADAEGRLYPAGAQPSAAAGAAEVRTFIGFAHLVRRDALRAVGGYREMLQINGEERELSLRLLDAGFRIVYLPDAPVAHLADAAGRDARLYLHQTIRNDVLAALLNEPLPLLPVSVGVRLMRYFRMRRAWGQADPGGFGRIVGAVARALPRVRRERRAVRWSTLRAWRGLAQSPPYRAPDDPS